jgi:hypothetical protein
MQEEIVVQKVQELTSDHKKFLKYVKHLYVKTQKESLEFELINNENWNVKINANLSFILKDNGQLIVNNQLIRVIDWKFSNNVTYLKTTSINGPSMTNDRIFKAFFVTENSNTVEKYGASKIKKFKDN